MKFIFTLIFSVFLQFSIYSQGFKVSQTKLEFDLPNSEWALKEELTRGNQTYQFFKRTPIIDEQEREVIPNITIIVEPEVSYDVVTYSALKRGEMPIEIEAMSIPTDHEMKYENGLIYKGTYKDKYGPHRVYYVFLKNNDAGIRVICDVTADLFEQVAPEFMAMLKSIRETDD